MQLSVSRLVQYPVLCSFNTLLVFISMKGKRLLLLLLASYLCSSYHRAELIAIKAALVTLVAKLDGNKKKYLFCKDSQSSILDSGPDRGAVEPEVDPYLKHMAPSTPLGE